MDLSHWVSSIVAFLRAGYPNGMPTTGYVPLAALSHRRASSDEISAITSGLVMHGRRPISATDVGVAITHITNDMPSQDDIARVKRRLDAMGRARG
ncbi:DUF3349 domain-containing protein [Mycobacterium heidelbergense]|uniref:Uncharacterized protein n=1 Tax=Mycobacterium heidelbergense TaxID=53376 RepID=A0A1X0DUA5_MYCHE|nr:DUF3349 domain-containing protein [Mycobacterium heidelbergense]MCV7049853.1 DUF3349 domain-containing protein [Mycobacterium heidelbergense]ORA75974.1 hypothetical protein BST25_03020 [Mycobacterium heidelbergense]BBZ52322.1 hypothetical protein MHEI_40390 [Mycobacterium heidelbergense]